MIASSKGTSRSQISNMAVIQMRLGILHVDLTSEGGGGCEWGPSKTEIDTTSCIVLLIGD